MQPSEANFSLENILTGIILGFYRRLERRYRFQQLVFFLRQRRAVYRGASFNIICDLAFYLGGLKKAYKLEWASKLAGGILVVKQKQHAHFLSGACFATFRRIPEASCQLLSHLAASSELIYRRPFSVVRVCLSRIALP